MLATEPNIQNVIRMIKGERLFKFGDLYRINDNVSTAIDAHNKTVEAAEKHAITIGEYLDGSTSMIESGMLDIDEVVKKKQSSLELCMEVAHLFKSTGTIFDMVRDDSPSFIAEIDSAIETRRESIRAGLNEQGISASAFSSAESGDDEINTLRTKKTDFEKLRLSTNQTEHGLKEMSIKLVLMAFAP